MTYLPYLAGPLAGLAIIMLTTGLVLRRPGHSLSQSLGGYVAVGANDTAPNAVPFVRSGQRPARLPSEVAAEWGARLLSRLRLDRQVTGLMPWLTQHLSRADLSLTPREAAVILVGAGIGGLLMGLLLWSSIAGVLASMAAGPGVVVLYVRYRQKRRLRVFGDQLPEVLAVLTINLRAGLSIVQGLDNMSRQTRAPAAQEFGALIRETRLGISLDHALRNLALCIDNPDLNLLVNAIIIQRETGGNLITMVETIEATVRERVRIRGEVRTLTAQTQMGGWIITALPVVLGFTLYLINPSGMSFFWTDLIGIIMGAATVFFVVVGNLVLRRITKIEL